MSDMGAPFNGEGRPPGFLYPNGWSEEKVQAVVSDWALAVFIPPSSVVDDDQMVVGAAILGGDGSMGPMQAVDALRHLALAIEARTKGQMN